MIYHDTVARLLVLALLLAAAPATFSEEIPVVRFTVERFTVEGANPLSADATNRILAPFKGQYEGVDGLLSAADTLEQAFADKGYAFHRVILPPQKLDQGTIRLKVVVLKLGKVTVTGNTHFSQANILASLPPLQPGRTPNTRELSRALDLANQHPAKSVLLNLKESDTPDTVDATVTVKDRRPYQFFASLNDIGTDQTGVLRLSVGAQHSNLWNRDHRFTLTYTLAPDSIDSVSQVGANYQFPFYSDASLISLFYVRSDVDVGDIAGVSGPIFNVAGAGQFFGFNYTHNLFKIGNYSHDWQLGMQDKVFTNRASIVKNGKVVVRSRPLLLQYDGGWRGEQWRTGFYVQFAKNFASGRHNNDTDYAASRLGAGDQWEALRFGGSFTRFLPKEWMLRGMFDAQWADQPLIAGEQFGVGGANSVRGFQERVIAGDGGYRASAELWTPPAPFLYGLRALAFYDVGMITKKKTPPRETDDDTIASAGLGLRWQWKDQIIATLDYGASLAGVQQSGSDEQKDSGRWHFNLVYRF